MNKGTKEFLMTYGWAILVVLIAMGALAYFGVLTTKTFLPIETFCEKYPDECVCEEWTKICYNQDKVPYLCNEKECKDWRKKTYCELNPNDQEKCVCDEYGYNFGDFVGTYKIDEEKFYKKFKDIFGRIFEDNDTVRWTINECFLEGICIPIEPYDFAGVGEICIKSHEANLCEKENPEWIWDNTFENVTLRNGSKGVGWKTCQKKTIQDLTCEELDREFNCWGKLKCNNLFEDCDKDCDLYWMIKKGC